MSQGSSAGREPIQPEDAGAVGGPLREAVGAALVPRWVAALRTQVFTGVAALGLVLFGGMTALVTGGLTADLDLAATHAVQGIGVPLFGPLMLAVSGIGFFPQNVLMVAAIAALLWRAGFRTESRFALLAGTSVALTEAVKWLVARPRPSADLVTVVQSAGSYSFPSGHTLFYVTFFGFLAYLAYAHVKAGRVRTVALWVTGLLIVLVRPSRIWMGHHWVSDVLASYALGLSLLVVLVQWYGRRRLAPAEGTANGTADTSTPVTGENR